MRSGASKNSPRSEIAVVLVRLDHVASRIINANHGILSSSTAGMPKQLFRIIKMP